MKIFTTIHLPKPQLAKALAGIQPDDNVTRRGERNDHPGLTPAASPAHETVGTRNLREGQEILERLLQAITEQNLTHQNFQAVIEEQNMMILERINGTGATPRHGISTGRRID